MRQVQIRMPKETFQLVEKLVKLEKGMNISAALRYFIYRGMQDFKTKGTASLEPMARQSIKAYIDFLDTLESTKATDYIPGIMPTVATFEEQEKQLDKLNEE